MRFASLGRDIFISSIFFIINLEFTKYFIITPFSLYYTLKNQNFYVDMSILGKIYKNFSSILIFWSGSVMKKWGWTAHKMC